MAVRACLMRGGTSKGLFLRERLPDAQIASLLGTPDRTGMQLDGVGGGISSTSKVAVVTASNRPGTQVTCPGALFNAHCSSQVDYLFGQVDMHSGQVDWGGSCGNLASAVGLYAMAEGLVPIALEGPTAVSVWQANAEYRMEITLPDSAKTAPVRMAGVPGTALPITVDFLKPRFGSAGLFPSGRLCDSMTLPAGGQVDVTLACAVNPTIFVRAADVIPNCPVMELKYTEHLANAVLSLREQGARKMGLPLTDAVRVAFVEHPNEDFTATDGEEISRNSVDILGRITTPGRLHHAFTGTGAINLACMADIKGTIVHECLRDPSGCGSTIQLAHPAGVMSIHAECDVHDEVYSVARAGFVRTARMLMRGDVYLP